MSSTALDLRGGELHNLVVRDGRLRTRKGLAPVDEGDGSPGVYVAAFSVESPTTTEVWHYLFQQASGVVTLRVVTEEFVELFTVLIGPCPERPVVSYAVTNNQLMINSPSFPGPLYGIVGGGLVPAVKAASDNPNETALDLPPGHICAWNGFVVIATFNTLLINDGRVDPRTFTSSNAVSFPGTIYDVFQGPDGALYVFTSADVYVIPVDALSQAQLVLGFISTITGVQTGAPRNALSSAGRVLALAEDALLLVGLEQQQRIDLAPYEGKRYDSADVYVDDYRKQGRMFPTSTGCAVGFGSTRCFWLEVDVRNNFRAFVYDGSKKNAALVGTLRGRDGETLYVLSDQNVVSYAGNTDGAGSSAVDAFACLRVEAPADLSVSARTITVAADNVGGVTAVYSGGAYSELTVPTEGSDVVIGTALWSEDGKLYGREKRTVQHSIATRTADVQVEVSVVGGDRAVDMGDLLTRGQGASRRSRS